MCTDKQTMHKDTIIWDMPNYVPTSDRFEGTRCNERLDT